jgi:uncharacterized membrane protein
MKPTCHLEREVVAVQDPKVRNTVLAIVAVLLLLVAGFIIYRATRPPVASVSPEEMKMLTQPGGPASPVGGGAGQ